MVVISWFGRNKRWLLFVSVVVALVALFVVFIFPSWFWHPLGTQACIATYHNAEAIRDCKSYNWHSGLEANLALLPLLAFPAVFWVKHNCYEHGCPWMARMRGDDGHMRCKGCHKREHPEYAKAIAA